MVMPKLPSPPEWLRVWIIGAVATFGAWVLAFLLTFVVFGTLKEIFAGRGLIQSGHFEAGWGFSAGFCVVLFAGIVIPDRVSIQSALAGFVILCATLAPQEWYGEWEFVSVIIRPLFVGALLSFVTLVGPAQKRQNQRDKLRTRKGCDLNA